MLSTFGNKQFVHTTVVVDCNDHYRPVSEHGLPRHHNRQAHIVTSIECHQRHHPFRSGSLRGFISTVISGAFPCCERGVCLYLLKSQGQCRSRRLRCVCLGDFLQDPSLRRCLRSIRDVVWKSGAEMGLDGYPVQLIQSNPYPEDPLSKSTISSQYPISNGYPVDID